ncbi:RNA-dependent RNA polymerase [Saccharomyces 23S RNA narnavirus]|uniref:RNA-directed RNA polymerase n=1 Tax=Saccharomyces 23S RNA narnavirus TaxID=198599 RepID=RDRP_SCV23|nr:RNA-dependent RNA polymerase [Saccharomyces 23S RNA narnavirus]Q07048.2 RecName: Full=RNA-directed RNA polymerase; AltName: Full=p104 [Saccharomyces 23S RNA narnavirus]AAC98708.1 RNA-dependent RNA polymerase [Saccharomyces 23S RNA narnavirus]
MHHKVNVKTQREVHFPMDLLQACGASAPRPVARVSRATDLDRRYRCVLSLPEERARSVGCKWSSTRAALRRGLEELGSREFRRRLRLADDCWRAICAAVCTGRKFPSFSVTDRPARARLAKVYRMGRRLLVGVVCRGESVVSDLKQECADLRRVIFEGSTRIPSSSLWGLVGVLGWTSPERAMQLTFIGRALPYGSPDVERRALASHAATLSIPAECHPNYLVAAEQFAKSWADDNLPRKFRIYPIAVQESSCMEYSRAQGGLLQSFRKGFVGYDPAAPSADPDDLELAKERGFSRIRASWYSTFRYRGELKSTNQSLEARVAVVPERGFKARIVTTHSASRVTFGHQFRRYLLQGIRRHPALVDVIGGDHRRAVETMDGDFGLLRPDGRLLSADLTSASDRIPHDLVKAILRGIFSDPDRRPPGTSLADVFDLVLGPYHLHYPDGSEVTVRQGILMGLPTTWPLLCLIHLFWVELSDWAPARPNHSRGFVLGESFRICGDDLIAWWRPERIALYNQIAVDCGAQFSAGKHLESKTWGIFTEKVFTVKPVKMKVRVRSEPSLKGYVFSRSSAFSCRMGGKGITGIRAARLYTIGAMPRWSRRIRDVYPGSLEHRTASQRYGEPVTVYRFGRWSSAIPLRWAVRAPTRTVGNPVQSLPDWFTVGPAASSVAADSNAFGAVSRVLRRMFPGLPRKLASAGIPPYLPRVFGGGGLVKSTGLTTKIGAVASRRWMSRIGHDLYRSRERKSTLGRVWTLSTSPAYAASLHEVEKFMDRPDIILTRKCRNPMLKHARELGLFEEVFESRVGGGILWASLNGKALVESHSPSILQVSRNLRRSLACPSGGFLRPSAPIGKLVQRHTLPRGTVWFLESSATDSARQGGMGLPPPPPPPLGGGGMAGPPPPPFMGLRPESSVPTSVPFTPSMFSERLAALESLFGRPPPS